VLLGEPSRAQAELDAAARHLINLSDLHCKDARMTERHRRNQRPQTDVYRLPGQSAQRRPRVRWPREAVARAHVQEVVGPEEGTEAQFLRGSGDS
jgi:hypothetical protein